MATTQTNSLAKSAAVVAFAVMCSRILGLVRETVFADLFGAGNDYDAFVVAFRIPNLLRDLFGEGALSAAFVTVFSLYDSQRSPEETRRLACNVLTFFAIALSLISVLGMLGADSIVSLLAPDFAQIAGKSTLTVLLTRIMLPFLVCISLSAVVMGMLNTKGKFFIPALASSFFNLGSLIGGVSLAWLLPRYGQPAIVGMAIGTLLGGLLQLAVQLPTLYNTGFRYRPLIDLADPGLRHILRLMVPATIGLSATQLNIFINTSFAASCGQGAVSWLNYAFRLMQLPIGLFGVALSIAMMPMLSKQAAAKDLAAMRQTLVSALILVLALTAPATAGLMLLDRPIIALIYQHGVFTAADTAATATALSLYAVGLFAYASNKVLVPAFYAIDRTRYPVIASFLAVGINLIFIHLTIDRFHHLAIALSTSLTMLLNCLFLFTLLIWQMGRLPWGRLVSGAIKIIAATGVMALFLWGCRTFGADFFVSRPSLLGLSLAFSIGGAIVLYGAMLFALKLTEVTELWAAIARRFKKK
ncbi:MAG: murein biosynthesis integral membrane protein MurJ [Desulfobulbaceae bacterium]|jgi:putative peptidoglycan lipid II flippase|nr:murein biosynthesis integral membrane protein MurJ [Desulfobulbaceae bacterium]